MTWKVEKGPDGLPVWSGKDSVYDPTGTDRQNSHGFMALVVAAASIFAAWWVWDALYDPIWALRARDTSACSPETIYETCWGKAKPTWLREWVVPGLAFGGTFLLAALVVVVNLVWWGFQPAEWIKRTWTLTASPDGLTLETDGDGGGILDWGWSVKLADIARVEVAATAEWEPGRRYWRGDTFDTNYKDSVRRVSPAEVQAFLFMADGSRRVICTVNAGRESAATLAHSIRSWLDAQRSASPSIAAAPIAAASLPGGPIAEGFI